MTNKLFYVEDMKEYVMESRWYFAPGQTLENTTISGRGLALYANESEWKKITSHLDRNAKISEALQKERDYKKSMKEGSDALTKEWPNCTQNTHVRIAEQRRRREDELEQKRMKEHLVIRKEQEEIKAEYIKKVKKSLYYQKSQPRQLNGALLESEAIYEREKQIEFKKMMQGHEREEQEKYARSIREQDEEEKRANLKRKEEESKKKQELKQTYLKEIETKSSDTAEYRRKRAEKELVDGMNAKVELEMQDKIKQEDALQMRARRKADLLEHIRQKQELKREREKQDAEIDEVTRVFGEAKHRIDCFRKEKEDEKMRNLLVLQDIVSKKAVEDKSEKDALYEKMMRKGQEEQEQKDEKKRQHELEKIKLFRQDMQDNRRAFLQREAKEKEEAEELKKWHLLNRQKKDEVIRKYNEDQRRKQTERTKQYRNDLLQQMEENKNKIADGSADASAAETYVAQKLDAQDKEFFAYADELLEHCKSRGRTTYPVEKVIEDYKVQNNMKLPTIRNCVSADEYESRMSEMLNTQPGKMCHNPRSDPTYQKCRHCKTKIIS